MITIDCRGRHYVDHSPLEISELCFLLSQSTDCLRLYYQHDVKHRILQKVQVRPTFTRKTEANVYSISLITWFSTVLKRLAMRRNTLDGENTSTPISCSLRHPLRSDSAESIASMINGASVDCKTLNLNTAGPCPSACTISAPFQSPTIRGRI